MCDQSVRDVNLPFSEECLSGAHVKMQWDKRGQPFQRHFLPKNLVMLKVNFMKSLLLLFALAPLTGCMTSPGQLENIGSKENPYFFSGFMTGPNEEVHLYARNAVTKQWHLVGKTTSSSTSIKHFGLNWYAWNIVTTLPDPTWHRGDDGCVTRFYGWVEARDKDGNPLRTWKEGFYDYFLHADNLDDLWGRYGRGRGGCFVFAYE